MPDLTDKEIEQALAIKVMGYERPWTWHPLTRVEHAMQLVPKMREMGNNFDLMVNRDGEGYIAFFYPRERGYSMHSDENPARAISLAAYEAVCR